MATKKKSGVNSDSECAALEKKLQARGVNVKDVRKRIASFRCETPSWGYGQGGTRFATFHHPGEARTVEEKVADAAEVQRLTKICPSVALHIPWDKTDRWDKLAAFAKERGVRIGAINPNLFQDPSYQFGSIAHPSAEVRKKARKHFAECVDIMRTVGSDVLSLWFADGTDYPGQDDFRRRKHRVEEELRALHGMLPAKARMLVEYKLYEPSFYHTDIADWGMALHFARHAGEKASVLVDLGHHAQGVNIEHLVAFLIDEKRLGGFHFNNRKYGDDDLTCGSVNPYELFLIFVELTTAEAEKGTLPQPPAYMIDQCHIAKPKIAAMLQTVERLQTAQAKALIVNREKLNAARNACDVVGAEEALREAFETDVEPLLRSVREEMGAAAEPLKTFLKSAYLAQTAEQRKR